MSRYNSVYFKHTEFSGAALKSHFTKSVMVGFSPRTMGNMQNICFAPCSGFCEKTQPSIKV